MRQRGNRWSWQLFFLYIEKNPARFMITSYRNIVLVNLTLTNVNRLGGKKVFLWPWYDRNLTRLYLHENKSVSGREMRLNQTNCKSLEANFLGMLQTFNIGPFLKISKIFSNKLTNPCIIFYIYINGEISMDWQETFWKTAWKDQMCTCYIPC